MKRTKTQYELLPLSTDAPSSLTLEGKEIRLNPHGKTVIQDEGLAHEVNAAYGYKSREKGMAGKVMAVPVDDLDPRQTKGYPTYHRLPRALKYKTIAERDAARQKERNP